jgi:pyruvate kinase
MLKSMTVHPRPTRAEVSDVANAVFDGTDALMLSGETAIGKYPIKSVEMMAAVARSAERYIERVGESVHSEICGSYSTGDAICHGAAETVRDLGAKLVAVYTLSGMTALLMSKYHTSVPVLGLSQSSETLRRMSMYRGVTPVRVPEIKDIDKACRALESRVVSEDLAAKNDRIVIITGSTLGRKGGTNILRVHRIGTPQVTRAFRDKASPAL